MELAFIGRLVAACAVIALVLVVVHYGARFARRSSGLPRAHGSLLSIVETAFLPGAASLHVIRVCERYYVVGRSGAHIQTLAEIASEDVASRRALSARAPASVLGALRDVLSRLAGPSR